MFTMRRVTAEDAQAIGAVFDASVRDGWRFLGEVVERPMFTPKQWDDLVAHLAPPHALIAAVDDGDVIIGYSAVHADTGELFLLFVHPEHSAKASDGRCWTPRTR